eukprot:TRINITY_DN80416_c0_g1_i1.p1 TRINITY_DN80416_c0_g1~~TRINITY_DN80416_c0_g1_i1.p1  ORF type:complete len:128 (-),score=11.40 TRINITY_DN80416_c0_g1_i1:151-534(-)
MKGALPLCSKSRHIVFYVCPCSFKEMVHDLDALAMASESRRHSGKLVFVPLLVLLSHTIRSECSQSLQMQHVTSVVPVTVSRYSWCSALTLTEAASVHLRPINDAGSPYHPLKPKQDQAAKPLEGDA